MKYRVTEGQVYHEGAYYLKGQTLELTNEQAHRLENVEAVHSLEAAKGKLERKPKNPTKLPAAEIGEDDLS
jgi:hypothetical protein